MAVMAKSQHIASELYFNWTKRMNIFSHVSNANSIAIRTRTTVNSLFAINQINELVWVNIDAE